MPSGYMAIRPYTFTEETRFLYLGEMSDRVGCVSGELTVAEFK